MSACKIFPKSELRFFLLLTLICLSYLPRCNVIYLLVIMIVNFWVYVFLCKISTSIKIIPLLYIWSIRLHYLYFCEYHVIYICTVHVCVQACSGTFHLYQQIDNNAMFLINICCKLLTNQYQNQLGSFCPIDMRNKIIIKI